MVSENKIVELVDTRRTTMTTNDRRQTLKGSQRYIITRQIYLSKNIQSPTRPFHIATIIESKKESKDFYTLLNQNDRIPTAKIKLQQLYNIDDSTRVDFFNSPFNIIKSTSQQWLQVRISHNNNYLF